MTEDEAKTKACCHGPQRPAQNGTCIGSACMAWIWHGPTSETAHTDNLTETAEGRRPVGDPPMPHGDGWIASGQPRQKGYERSKKDGLPPALEQRWERPITQVEGSCGYVPRGGYW